MARGSPPFDDEAAEVTAREAHLHPDTRLSLRSEAGWDGVVERAVQVREAGVDQHPRDRVDHRRRRLGINRPCAVACTRQARADQGELLAASAASRGRRALTVPRATRGFTNVPALGRAALATH